MQVQLAVSTVVFAMRPDPATGKLAMWLPLVRRIREPYLGQWALPGGPLQADEDLVTSAKNTLERTTGLAPRYLEQLYSFGAVNRSATATAPRVVSIVYWALVRPDELENLHESENVEWFLADAVSDLAFDHDEILRYAVDRLRAKVGYSPIAYAFLDDEFTLAALRAVHEAVLHTSLDPANFRRQILATGAFEPTGRHVQGAKHRPPALYCFTGPTTTKEPT